MITNRALSYGGSSFTLSVNLNISIEEAIKIENAYKALHPGIYSWGNKTLEKAMKTGYIESADGFKLRLPEYSDFLKLKMQLDRFSRTDWDRYKVGKQEHNALQLDKYYVIQYKKEYQFYLEERMWISKYFKLKGSYFRLCLNNPRRMGAHINV